MIILSLARGKSASISRKQNVIAMNGYLFTAGLTQTQVYPTPGRGGQMVDSIRHWDSCMSAIIYGGDTERAQKRFEAWSAGLRKAKTRSRRKSKKSSPRSL